MLNNTEIKVILFDLGGVLVELDGPPFKAHWLRQPMAEEDNWRSWGQSPLVEAFESGHLSASDFAAGIIKEFNLRINEETFLREFTAWPKGLFDGVPAMLAELKNRYVLSCYSNTSALHWPRMMNDMGLARMLDHKYASFELACFKPARKGFDLIVKDLQVDAAEVLFFDDNPANVEAAKNAGLKARLARGPAAVKQALG